MPESVGPLRQLRDGCVLAVRVRPRSDRDEVSGISVRTGVDARVVVRVRSAPVDDAANESCRRVVAEALGLAASRVRVVSGMRSRDKSLSIGADPARILGWLAGLGSLEGQEAATEEDRA